MKSKLIVLSLAAVLALAYDHSVLAHEGHEHKMADGTMMDDDDRPQGQMDSASTQAIEVGNKICPVTGDKIPASGEEGAMGDEPVKYEHNGKIYNLCCKMCVKDFKKNPEKYSKIADDEAAQEKMAQDDQGDEGDQEGQGDHEKHEDQDHTQK